jgi:hypothetical protein
MSRWVLCLTVVLALLVVTSSSVRAAPPAAKGPTRLTLVEGKPVSFEGLKIDIKGVGYAHLAGSRNFSTCTLVIVSGDGKTTEVPLAREDGEGARPPRSATALGWRFTLELADPYRRPSSAVVLVDRAA